MATPVLMIDSKQKNILDAGFEAAFGGTAKAFHGQMLINSAFCLYSQVYKLF